MLYAIIGKLEIKYILCLISKSHSECYTFLIIIKNNVNIIICSVIVFMKLLNSAYVLFLGS